MTMPDQAPQTLDEILDSLEAEATYSDSNAWVTEQSKTEAKAALTALIERVIGDTKIPPESELWKYTSEGVAKFRLIAEQRKRLGELL